MNDPIARIFTPAEREAWLRSIRKVYSRMRSYGHRPRKCVMGDLELWSMHGVYAPDLYTDTLWFASRVRNIVGQQLRLLEIGTGTGAIAIYVALGGAYVTATDINPQAVRNAKLNVEWYCLGPCVSGSRVYVIESDMYDHVRSRYDFIFWSHPFNNSSEPVTDMLLRSGFDYEYRDLRKYVAGARGHLLPGGRLLLGSGDTADIEMITRLAKEYDYELNILDRETVPLATEMREQITLLLYEFVPK